MTDNTTIPDGYKKCYKCGRFLPRTTEYWHRNKNKPDGLTSACKDCARAIAKKWREENPERHKENLRRWAEENHEYKAEQDRQRRLENPELNRAAGKRYRERHKDRIREKNRKWYLANRDREREKRREYYAANKEQARERNQKRYRANKEYILRRNQEWKKANRGRVRGYWHTYKTRKLSADGTHTAEDVRLIYQQQNGLCWWCGKPVGDDYHVDHRVPLIKGGSNGPENLCISCPSCNTSKGAKMPGEWNGRLL